MWEGRLYVGIIKATPKYRDLARDGRFALHALLAEGDAEFWVTGVARQLTDEENSVLMAANEVWQVPVANGMFELDIRTAYGTIFRPGPDNLPIPDRRSFHDTAGTGAARPGRSGATAQGRAAA